MSPPSSYDININNTDGITGIYSRLYGSFPDYYFKFEFFYSPDGGNEYKQVTDELDMAGQ